MALQTIKDLQNALKTSSNVIQPEVKDTTYQKKLNYFTQNADKLYEKYGSTEYNRYLKYYTTKANAEKYGIDQNAIAPAYSKIDDLINNREKYEKQYGKIGYNTYYSSTYNLNKDEINTLNDAIALKEKGSYSAGLLTDEMKTKFKYTDDKEDILRQKLGYVPKSFDSYAKKLVADAKKASMTDEETEAELTEKQNASYWDSIDTGEEETITEQQVKDAINILNGVAVVDPKATPLSVVSNKAVESSELTSAQTTEDTEQDAKVKKLEQEIKELEIQKMKANRESYSSSDNSAFMQAKANYDTKVAELATLRKSYTDNKKSKEQAYYSDLKNTDDFTKYVAKGEEKGGFLEDVKKILPSLNNIEFQKALEQITDEEKNTYYYLLGKDGEESSKKYLKFIMEDLNARYGSKVAEIVPDNLLSAMAYSGKAGLDQFVQGTSQLFTKEALPTSGTQYASSQIREGLGGVGKAIYDIGTTSANMMPSILLSSLTGGVAGGLLGSATLGASAGGTAYNQALKQGYTEEQARSYGIMTGALEGGLQYLLGGIGKLGGKISSNVAAKAISKIDNVALKVAADFGTSALSEAGEEYLQEILTPIVRNETLDENNEFKPFTEEALYNAMMGALTSGVFKGADILSNQVSQNNTKNTETIEPNLEQVKQPKEQQVVSSNTEQTVEKQPEQLTFETPVKQSNTFDTENKIPSITKSKSKTTLKTEQTTNIDNNITIDELNAKTISEKIRNSKLGKTIEKNFLPKTQLDEKFKQDLETMNTTYQTTDNKTQKAVASEFVDNNFDKAERYIKESEILQTPADAAITAELIDRYRKTGREDEALELIRKTAVKFSKAGQFVQSAAIWSKSTPEGMVKAIDNVIKKANKKLSDEKQFQLSDEDAKTVMNYVEKSQGKTAEELADIFNELSKKRSLKNSNSSKAELQSLIDNNEVDVLQDAVYQNIMLYVLDKVPRTIGQKLSTIQAFAHLLNPRTIIRNITSNTSFKFQEMFTDYSASLFDSLMAKKTGQRTIGIPDFKPSTTKQNLKASVKGAQRANFEIQTGVQLNDEIGKYELFTQQIFPASKFKTLSALERALGYSLKTPDQFSKAAVEINEVRKQLKLQGKDIDGKSIDEMYKMADNDTLKFAREQALYNTFQNESFTSTFLQGVKKTLNLIGINKGDFGVGDLVIKYTKVPGNLIQRAVDYSPLGALKLIKYIGKSNINKFQQRDIIKTLGRVISGSTLATVGYLLSKAGLIIGADGEDEREKDFYEGQGLKGRKINLSAIERLILGGSLEIKNGDRLASFDFLETLNLPLSMGYEFSRADEQKLDTDTIIKNLTNAFSEELLDLPTLYIINSMVYAGTRKGSTMFDVVSVPLTQALPGFVPAPLRQFSSSIDEYQRNRKGLGESLQYNTPLRGNLLPRLGTFGQPIKQDTGILSFFNPGSTSTYNELSFSKELKALADRTKDVEVYPTGNAVKSFSRNNKTYTLTEKEQNEFMQSYGKILAASYKNILSSNSSDEEKVKQLKSAQTKIKDELKEYYILKKLPSVPKIK